MARVSLLAGLAVGKALRWTKGANDTSVTNGGDTINTSGQDFFTQGVSITLNGARSGQAVTAIIFGSPYLTLPTRSSPSSPVRLDPFFNGTVALNANDQGQVSIPLDLPVTPFSFNPQIIIPPGGDDIDVRLVSVSPTQAVVQLIGVVPGAGYSIDYYGIKGTTSDLIEDPPSTRATPSRPPPTSRWMTCRHGPCRRSSSRPVARASACGGSAARLRRFLGERYNFTGVIPAAGYSLQVTLKKSS